MQETSFILDRLVVVKIDATLWGGRKKLRKEDLILADGSVLPPEDLASLGSKKIADPRELAVFHRLKKEAERICLKVGTRFLGGFAVPQGTIESIRLDLERIAGSFAAARDDFLSRYDQTVEDWVARHPEFALAIRRAVDPVEVVAANLRFDYVVFRVNPAEPNEMADTEGPGNRLDQRVGCLSESLFREISQEANDLVESSLLGRASVTRKALSPFKRIRDKLDGLAFLDHRVQPVVETLTDLLGRVPKSGPLEGAYLGEVLATALLLSDPDKIRRHGEGLLEVEDLAPVQGLTQASGSESDEGPALPSGPAFGFEGILEETFSESGKSPETDEEASALAEDFWF